MKTQTDYYKIVNFDGQEIIVLDYTFDHGDGFKGATGSRFEPVSKASYKEQTRRVNVINFLEGCFTNDELAGKGGVNKLYTDIVNNGEVDQIMFDDSYSYLWDYLRETLNLSDKEAYIFTCTGGGRCFDKDFQGNINPELSAIIREFENN